jgi:hypothetical protein
MRAASLIAVWCVAQREKQKRKKNDESGMDAMRKFKRSILAD